MLYNVYMQIQYLKKHCFLLEYKTAKVLVNPYEGIKKEADIVLSSFNHPDFKNKDIGGAFLIDSAGEYEKSEIFIKAIGDSVVNYKKQEGLNVSFLLDAEDLRVVVLGAQGDKKISSKAQKEFGEVSIIILPVGGEGLLNPKDAQTVAFDLGANIAIPIAPEADDKAIEQFTKYVGNSVSIDKKKSIAKKTISHDKMEAWVFSP